MRSLTGWVVAAGIGTTHAVGALRGDLADLQVYLGSVGVLAHGGSPYDFAADNGDPFTYPPFAGLVLLPLSYLPQSGVRLMWTVATLAAIGAIAWLAAPSRRVGGWLAAALVATAPGSSNLRLGQISVFISLLVLVDCLDRVPPRWHGVATGLAAAVKLTPLAFLPYYWFTGRRRAAVVGALTFATATTLATAVLPRDSVRFWFTELWRTRRIGDLAQTGNQSLNGMAQRLSVDAPLLVGVVALVVLLIAYRRASVVADPLAGAIIVGAAALLASPVSWSHHQVWLVLAAVCVPAVWSAAIVLLMVLPLPAIGDVLPTPLAAVPDNARVLLALLVVIALGARHGSGDIPRQRTVSRSWQPWTSRTATPPTP